MADTNWLRQTKDNPLFPDTLWSRPENKRQAGKLLIIGGNSHLFSDVGLIYSAAQKAGIGIMRVILPDSLEKLLAKTFPEAEFAPSTPSGSFAKTALGKLIEHAEWADGILLAGDFGKNSETAVLLEGFVKKFTGQLILAGDSLDYFFQKPDELLNREETAFIGNLGQIQKIAQPRIAIKQSAELVQILNLLGTFTSAIKAEIIAETAGQIIVAAGGKISTTKASREGDGAGLAAYTSVWRLQQPEKPFESLTTAVYCYSYE